MSRLAYCVTAASVRWNDEKGITHPALDHLMKRGLQAEAARRVNEQGITAQQAEVEVVTEMRDQAAVDAGKVAAALEGAQPEAQAATPRARPVEREAAIAGAIGKMHQDPEESFQLSRRIQAAYWKIRAKTLAMKQAALTAEESEEIEHVRAFAELNAIVKALPPSVREKIGGTYTLAQLREQGRAITNFLVGRIKEIDKELEKHFQEVYQERIDKLLNSKLPKKSSAGVKKSVIGADAQEVVDRVAGYTKMTMDQVSARAWVIEAELMASTDPIQQSKLIMEQMELDTFGAIDQMTAAQMATAYESLVSTIAKGKAVWGSIEEARLKDAASKALEIKNTSPPASVAGAAETNRHRIRNFIGNYARNHGSLIQILEWMFPKASFIREWQSRAIKQDLADMTYQRDVQSRLVETLKKSIGTGMAWKVGDALMKMDKPNIPVPAAGGMATQREAIHYLFAWNQPRVRENMIDQGWTEEHIQVLRDATANPAAQAMSDFILKGYEEIYQMADPVYMRLYGMHLPRIEGIYAPMRYHVGGTVSEMTMTGGMPSSGVTPTALKARVDHKAKLKQVDALQVFTEHVAQMSHWIHMAEFIRETRGVLGNADVKLSIEQSVGSSGLGDLQRHLDAVTRNGVTRAGDVAGFNALVRHITSGVAVGALAFNLHSVAVQGDSGLRWMMAIPMHRWARVFLLHKWVPMISKMWKSESVQNRLKGGMDPVARFAMERDNMTPPRLLNLVNWAFWPLTHADAAATSVSSAIVYSDAVSQGATHEQAMEKMGEAVARFSQPTAITSKAQSLASASPAWKMLLMFASDPMLKTALAGEAIMDARAGKWESAVRKIVAIEVWALVAQTILNVWAHAAGKDDDYEDDEPWLFHNFFRAMALAPIQGAFVLGNVMEGLWSAVTGDRFFSKTPALQSFVDHVNKTGRNWDKLMEMNFSDPQFWKEVDNIGKLISTLTGGAGAAGYGLAHQAGKVILPQEEK